MLNKLIMMTTLLSLLLAVVVAPALADTVDHKEYTQEVMAPESYLEKSATKLVRGVTNMVTSPGEIPKQMVITTQSRGALGLVLGLFKGVGMTIIRAGAGVWETATFIFPTIDGDFKPILKPEYVWNRSEPVYR